MVDLDHQNSLESGSDNGKILDRIPEILTPFLTGGNSGHFGDGSTCRRDFDCAGNQKCCHVQVAKYRFRLGCRYPRRNYF